MNQSRWTGAVRGGLMGIAAGLTIFLSEWALTKFHAEISFRTYLFFGVLFVGGGFIGGSVFSFLLNLIGPRVNVLKEAQRNKNFEAASFLFMTFFLYGFYYINEKITPGVGIFAPVSLGATGLHLVFSAVLFRLVMAWRSDSSAGLWSLVQVGVLPVVALVAVNFRFFLWHGPDTDVTELFVATVAFGGAGISAFLIITALGKVVTNPLGKATVSLTLACACLITFGKWGRPSGESFQLTATKSSDSVAATRQKNVIWIVMDTARRDQISVYDSERQLTPNIDKFAEEALVMNRAISSAPWTIPSHASMFTGMFPSKHAAHRGVPGGTFTNPLATDHLTIAEILLSHGYDTAAIAGNVAGLSRNFGFSQGFNYYFDGRPIVYNLLWGRALMALSKHFRANVLQMNEVCLSSELNGLTFDWLDSRPKDLPFFLFLNYMEAHDGIEQIPEPYRSMFGFSRDEYDRVFDGFDQGKVVRFEAEVTPEHLAMAEKRVARRVAFMDHNIGLLLDRLKQEGLYDESIIIITSDHGELNGEHNSFGHNTDLYNELIWVPMIIKYPGSWKKGFSDKTVQNVDIMPEVLKELGFEIPREVQGQAFDEVSHEIIAELFEQKKAQALLYPERYYRDLRAIFTNVGSDSLKYIWSSNGDDEIYDMREDLRELNNLAKKKQELVSPLGERLEAWLDSFDPINFGSDGQTTYSKEVEDRLRSLGYIK